MLIYSLLFPLLCSYIAASRFGNITVVSDHNLGSTCEFQPICYKKNKKSKMMEGMSFVSSLFRSMKNLSKEVKHMKEERYNENSRWFQDEEGPCTSY